MKKQLAIFLILAFIIGASGIGMWKLQTVDGTAQALDTKPSTRVSSKTDGTWTHVETFTGASYTQTDPFYIQGDKFRVKYTANPAENIDNQTDSKSFIVVQAKNQLPNDRFLYGHVNENLDMPVSGTLEVDQGNGYYYLIIWDMSFANWRIEVESFQ